MSVASPSSRAARAAGLGASPPPSVAADRAFCRAMLPRVSRTFAINIRLLSGSMGEAVRIGYLLCRIADTIEDAWPGDRREIERRFDQLLAGVRGSAGDAQALAEAASVLRGRASAPHVDLVSQTPRVLHAFATLSEGDRFDVAEAVATLSMGMRRYAGRAAERTNGVAPSGPPVVSYLDDEFELRDYCWIVAGCVGVMLTRLFGRRAPESSRDAERLVLAPAVGEGLQLTNILLDWPADVRGGRCHVPASWLREFDLAPQDLIGAPRPETEVLASRLETLATTALDRVPEYLATIPSRHVRYRMFCLWPALWAGASLRHARRDPTFPWGAERPRLPKTELWGIASGALARGHSTAGVAGMFNDLSAADPARAADPPPAPRP